MSVFQCYMQPEGGRRFRYHMSLSETYGSNAT